MIAVRVDDFLSGEDHAIARAVETLMRAEHNVALWEVPHVDDARPRSSAVRTPLDHGGERTQPLGAKVPDAAQVSRMA